MTKPPATKRKLMRLAMPPHDCMDLEPPDVAAVRAWITGTASPDQQRHAARVVIEKISQAYLPSFRSDKDGGARVSDYLEGRRSVGLWLIDLQHMSPKQFQKD